MSAGSIGTAGITAGSVYASSVSAGSVAVSGGVSAGSVNATSNIKSGAGTLGPFVILQTNYIDVTSGSYTGFTSSNSIIFSENGNPGVNSAIGNASGFGRLSDGSSDGITWNSARLVMRGVTLNTGTTGNSIVLQPFAIQSTSGNVFTQASFTVTDAGSNCGYTTWISPWFSTNIVSDIQALGVKALSINSATGGNVRVGTTYMQFKY